MNRNRAPLSGSDGQKKPPARPAPRARSTLPRIEFGRSKRGDYVYYIALIFAAMASWLVALLPQFVVVRIALVIGWLSYVKSNNSRHNVCSNLSHIFDLPLDTPEITSRAKAVFRTNALNVLDLFQIPHMSPKDYDESVTVIGGSWKTLD